ncbi:MAG TPA: 1-deoxy-D-xylulose-5-phosphate synthase, partial [Planctomycetaceae bacterium]|nr:1-deoxy-D-xylulose-5-phosphate synthase [Planctomycetaceae bacterium]
KPGSSSPKAFTDVVSSSIFQAMTDNERVVVLTAAMCAGNKLGKVRDGFPDRFFDTGICEAHAVAFAGGMAKAGLRPIVDIYSTFLQRSFDHIFQEVALQNLPVTFCMDRAGIAGEDGPTHHGAFDNAYMRCFPNIVNMSPGDALDVEPMLEFSLQHDGPTAIRYPKAAADSVERQVAPVELGKSEVYIWGKDGMLIAFGSLFTSCIQAAEKLREEGLDVGVINARFSKPLDTEVIHQALQESGFVITIEEGTLCGGFGSAVLESANDAGLNTSHLKRLGIPDRFIEHGNRKELLADLGLDVAGITATARELAQQTKVAIND